MLFGIVLLAAALRLVQLGTYPQHFDNDESVLSYDAWSLWLTGADHHGIVLPNHFRAFNEYLPGLAQYLTAPFVGLLGLSTTAARLPFALMGVATVWLTGLIGRLWFGRRAGLLAALLLATEPWHLTFSRLALTNSSVPFFCVLALYVFTLAARRLGQQDQSMRWRSILGWIGVSALCFALLTRTYQPLKIEAPLIFVGCMLAFWIVRPGRWRIVLPWVGLYGLFTALQWLDQLVHWSLFQVQFDHNNVLHLANWPFVLLSHYSSQYDPSRLFFDGFGGGQSIHPPGIGQLFWLEGIMWIAALVGLARARLPKTGFNTILLLGWWFAVWPIAAALTITGVPTETRTVDFLPLPELLAGYGAVVILNALLQSRSRLVRLNGVGIIAAAGLIYVAFNLYFLSNFFRPVTTDVPYNLGLESVLGQVMAESTDCDPIWVEDGNQAYIYFLFSSRYPPAKFQKAAHFETSVPPDAFNYIPWFNNVRFADVNTILNPASFKFALPPLCEGPHNSFILLRRAFESPDWKLIAVTKSETGDVLWAAYRRKS